MVWSVTASLLEGFGMTLKIFGLTLAFAIPLGLLIAFGSMSRFKPLKWLQLIAIYYGPGLVLGSQWWGTGNQGRFVAVLVAFVLNYACYFSVIYRGGIEAIPKGQYEAAQVLGMTKSQTFFRVILLQVVKRIVPPMSNEIITLVKDTSLSRVIACYEIIWNAQVYIKSNGLIWPLFYTGVFYLLFNGILTVFFGWLERKMSYFRV